MNTKEPDGARAPVGQHLFSQSPACFREEHDVFVELPKVLRDPPGLAGCLQQMGTSVCQRYTHVLENKICSRNFSIWSLESYGI